MDGDAPDSAPTHERLRTLQSSVDVEVDLRSRRSAPGSCVVPSWPELSGTYASCSAHTNVQPLSSPSR